jgi:hypothetical protein
MSTLITPIAEIKMGPVDVVALETHSERREILEEQEFEQIHSNRV